MRLEGASVCPRGIGAAALARAPPAIGHNGHCAEGTGYVMCPHGIEALIPVRMFQRYQLHETMPPKHLTNGGH